MKDESALHVCVSCRVQRRVDTGIIVWDECMLLFQVGDGCMRLFIEVWQ